MHIDIIIIMMKRRKSPSWVRSLYFICVCKCNNF